MEMASAGICVIHEEKCGVYKNCCIHDDKCGPYTRANPAIHGLFKPIELTEDTQKHFSQIKLKYSVEYNEVKLVESRLGRSIMEKELICSYHRYSLGVGWRPPKTCQHPLHEKTIKQKKSSATRTAPLHVIDQVIQQYGKPFPVGACMCFPHLKEINKSKSIANEVAVDAAESMEDETDLTYEPPEICISEDTLNASNETSTNISTCLERSPAMKIKRKRIEDLSDSTKKSYQRYFQNKYKVLKRSLKEKFAEGAAPGQTDEFISQIMEYSSDDDDDDAIPDDLQNLLTKYERSDSMSQLVILSLIDHSKYTHKYIQNTFGCSKYMLDKAIALGKETSLELPIKKTFTRNKLDISKCEHFLDFIFSHGLIQDIAYGVNKLKFDSGDTQILPKAILTCKYSHAIGFYLSTCKEIGYTPVSESTLWAILRGIKPSQRKSLAGLDDIVAAGMNGFNTLQVTSEPYSNNSELRDALEAGRRYLKTKYQLHCTTESPIKTHNIGFALSDPNETKLQCSSAENATEAVCSDCLSLWKAVQEVRNIALSKACPELLYDVNNAIRDIILYVKHLLRDVQQKKAKTFSFEQLDSSSFFWLKDYCQKILPVKYREGQLDYFGKKGMSLHVDIFFTKVNKEMQKYIYFTCMQRGNQDMEDVLSIADNLLKKVHNDHPQISKIFTKSDNAGCYHGSLSLEALYNLCKANGMTLTRYDFNEPFRGKDQCDRESAAAKTIIKSYINAGNDLMSAEDVFNGMHYGYGMKDSEICVAEVDSKKSLLNGKKIKKFGSYHSIKFTEKGMLLWRYYEIGHSVFKPFTGVNFTSGIEMKIPFSKTEKMKRQIKTVEAKPRSDRTLSNLFFCNEIGCSQLFESQAEFEAHSVSGQHVGINAKTSMDKVKQIYASKMKMSTPTPAIRTSNISADGDNMDVICQKYPVMETFMSKGWAIPTYTYFRYSSKQKKILYDLFMQGEHNGKKMTAEQVHLEIRRKLSVEEYVTPKQIKSLYSNWSRKLRQGKLIEVEEDEEILDSDENDNASDYAQEHANYVREQTEEIIQTLLVKENDWVAVMYEKEWFPSIILNVQSDGVTVKSMKYAFKGKNQFKWPDRDDIFFYANDDILCCLDPPVPINNRYFGISNENFIEVSNALQQKLM